VLFADEVERHIQLAVKLVEGRTGDHDPARVGQLLQAGRDVDPVAVDVVVDQRHVAEVDADAEDQPLGRGQAALRSAAPCWIATAQATASTTLSKATIAPSPISLTMRPRCAATRGSVSSARTALSRAIVPASSASIAVE
jgi:hypothetical protein